MKKAVVLLVVGVVLFGVCAQSANAQNANIAQSIIGTWVDQRGNTWVFNANGTMTRETLMTNARTGAATRFKGEYKYGITNTKLVLVDSDYGTGDAESDSFDISISSDGKTLIVAGDYVSRSSSGVLSSFSRNTYWLVKK
jgi:hypothetical protein